MPHILGGDLAGVIEAVADDVQGWEAGARVAACFAGLGREINGSYAEFCALPADQLVALPDEVDFQAAVAAGASFADAHLALVTNGKLKKADLVVIRGASGDIGARRRTDRKRARRQSHRHQRGRICEPLAGDWR